MPDYLPADAHRASSDGLDADVRMQLYSHRSTQRSLLVPAVAEPLLVWVISGSARVEERELGQDWTSTAVSAGDFFLTMSPEPYEMRWATDDAAGFQVMHLYLSQRLLDLAAREVLGKAHALRLREVSGARDAHVSSLMALLHREMTRQGDTSSLCVQGIAQALAVHLFRHYRDASDAGKAANALPAYKLQRVIDHMRQGLANPFSLAVVAADAGMSAFHFSRLFHRATGHSPSQYFIQLRLEKARHLLLASGLSVIEIALEVGYASPSHFAQVFKRHTGTTPRAFRRG